MTEQPTVESAKGAKNGIADWLSRFSYMEPDDSDSEKMVLQAGHARMCEIFENTLPTVEELKAAYAQEDPAELKDVAFARPPFYEDRRTGRLYVPTALRNGS